MKNRTGSGLAGMGAGALNGLFGAGGGMILSPLLGKLTNVSEQVLFPCSVAILLPICIVSLLFTTGWVAFSFQQALPYLIGSGLGGIFAGKFRNHIPTKWLHRVLGILIIWGGIRFLW